MKPYPGMEYLKMWWWIFEQKQAFLGFRYSWTYFEKKKVTTSFLATRSGSGLHLKGSIFSQRGKIKILLIISENIKTAFLHMKLCPGSVSYSMSHNRLLVYTLCVKPFSHKMSSIIQPMIHHLTICVRNRCAKFTIHLWNKQFCLFSYARKVGSWGRGTRTTVVDSQPWTGFHTNKVKVSAIITLKVLWFVFENFWFGLSLLRIDSL